MNFEALGRMAYPGRFIIMGGIPDSCRVLLAYGLTGRSPSSKARRLVETSDGVEIEVTDEETLKKGLPALLVYKAMRFGDGFVVVSNGGQTDVVFDRTKKLLEAGAELDPAKFLTATTRDPYMVDTIDLVSFEPDDPNFTSRITGLLFTKQFDGALQVIGRDPHGQRSRRVSGLCTSKDRAHMVSTYAGPNKDPLPRFEDWPIGHSLEGAPMDAAPIARAIWDQLGKDVRVSVVAAIISKYAAPEVAIVNACDE